MKLSGLIYSFPKEVKAFIFVFLVVLSVGYFTGLMFVEETSSLSSKGIEYNYLGNENDELATEMKFRKSEREMLTLVHGHVLSMALIFFIVGAILSTTDINTKLKSFLLVEPLISIILTFGGIYFLWNGVLWAKYLVMISGTLMSLSYALSVLIIIYQLFQRKS